MPNRFTNAVVVTGAMHPTQTLAFFEVLAATISTHPSPTAAPPCSMIHSELVLMMTGMAIKVSDNVLVPILLLEKNQSSQWSQR
jgi:hypothetical protein